MGVHLTDAASQEEFRTRIATFAKTAPKGSWILNGSWDHERWSPVALPTHQLIDNVMRLAGVGKDTKDIAGGVIVRDRDGNPTGIFKDAAMTLIYRTIPEEDQSQVEAEFLASQAVAAQNRITSFQDMAVEDDTQGPLKVRVLQSLQRQGKLKIRVAENLYLPLASHMAELGIQADFKDGLFHVGGLKNFADGGLGASTAWMFEEFSDSKGNYGIASPMLQQPEKLYAQYKQADQAGLQLMTHAIGDRANHEVLNLYERLEEEDGPRDRRLRIEHAQHLCPDDIARFSKLQVIASMQPYHAIDDGRWAEKRIGPMRIRTAYAFRSLLDSGSTLCFGSDWPVAP